MVTGTAGKSLYSYKHVILSVSSYRVVKSRWNELSQTDKNLTLSWQRNHLWGILTFQISTLRLSAEHSGETARDHTLLPVKLTLNSKNKLQAFPTLTQPHHYKAPFLFSQLCSQTVKAATQTVCVEAKSASHQVQIAALSSSSASSSSPSSSSCCYHYHSALCNMMPT